MALSRSDHKAIALSMAQELRKVLTGANAKRLLDKHKMKMAPDGDETGPEESEGLDEMMAELEAEPKDVEVSPDEMHSRGGMPSDEDAAKKGLMGMGKGDAPPPSMPVKGSKFPLTKFRRR